MNGGEVGDGGGLGGESLEDLDPVVYWLDDGQDRREGDGTQDVKGDEALEGAERNGNNIGPSVVIKSDSESLEGIDYAYVAEAQRSTLIFPTPEFPLFVTLTSP